MADNIFASLVGKTGKEAQQILMGSGFTGEYTLFND